MDPLKLLIFIQKLQFEIFGFLNFEWFSIDFFDWSKVAVHVSQKSIHPMNKIQSIIRSVQM